jgi:putative serine/threonine protein kinase
MKNTKKSARAMVKAGIDQLFKEPYVNVLCYPKATRRELERRLRELQSLGITELEFTGEKRLLNTRILGKGCVGLVALAHGKTGVVALKIRRTDADRTSMLREGKLLQMANAVQVGPKFVAATKNFLAMQFIQGELLPQWLEKIVEKSRLRQLLRDLLEQCWRLDAICLDHGELSHAPKHVIIDENDKAFIVDFETASTDRRPSNVTSISQFLFLSEFSPSITRKIGLRDKKLLIDSLRRYKRDINHDNILRVMESCGL